MQCLKQEVHAQQLCAGLVHEVAFVAKMCARMARGWRDGAVKSRQSAKERSWGMNPSLAEADMARRRRRGGYDDRQDEPGECHTRRARSQASFAAVCTIA